MSDKEQKPPEPGSSQLSDAEIEREIRSGRTFSIAEALGRSAGDLMKGASPITRKQQAEFEIEELIDSRLVDSEGALSTELLRRAKVSQELLENYDEPLAALASVIESILDSVDSLSRFVTRVDAEWGRIYLERPHFETDQRQPDSNDPYTRDSVRATLTALLGSLRETSG